MVHLLKPLLLMIRQRNAQPPVANLPLFRRFRAGCPLAAR
jgi:hypothetical protein